MRTIEERRSMPQAGERKAVSFRTFYFTKVLLLLLATPAAGQVEDYTFATNNGAITITGYTGPGGLVSIPATITGLPVTSIGTAAFRWCTNLTSVSFPDGVTNIAWFAFHGCTGLTHLALPGSVTHGLSF